MFDRRFLSAAAMFDAFIGAAPMIYRARQGGPGVGNYHKPGGKTYRVPGGGKRECERRLRQMAARRAAP